MSDLSPLYSSQSSYSDVVSPLVILNQQGLIEESNDAWKELGAANNLQAFHSVVGADYFQGRAESDFPLEDTAARGIKSVMAGEATQYNKIYICHSSQRQQWFHLWVSQLRNKRHTMLIHEDVTALHQARHEVLRGVEQNTRILENIQEACFTLDDEWRFTYLNLRAAKLLQQPVAALLGQTLWNAFPDTQGTVFDQQFRRAVNEQQPVLFEAFFPVVYAWFEVNAYPYQGSLAVYFQNVNVRRADAQTHSERDLSLELIINGAALPEILNHIADMVERQAPGYVCVIMLAQDQHLYLSAAPSLPAEFRQVLNSLDGTADEWPCIRALVSRQPVSDEQISWPSFGSALRDFSNQQGFQACSSVPLLNEFQELLGTLDLYATTPGLFPAQVFQVIDKAQHLATLATEHHRLAERLLYRDQYDSLTGLINRQLFEERLREAIHIAQKTQGPLALLFIDVDNFKSINDLLGHSSGDEVLRELARRLLSCVQLHDTVARISGDEFTVMLPFSTQTDAIQMAKAFLTTLTKPFTIGDRELYIMASIGISTIPEGGSDAEALRVTADLAMYRAKSHKTGFAVFEKEFNRRSHERFELTAALRKALALNELEVYYQPLMRLEDHALIGVEALLRWHHPQLGGSRSSGTVSHVRKPIHNSIFPSEFKSV